MTSIATSRTPNEAWTLVATRGDERALRFVEAARRAGLPEPKVVDYHDACARPARIDETRGRLRFDAPGREPNVHLALLLRGEAAARAEGAPALERDAAHLALADRGRIAAPRQLHLGFIGLVRELAQRAANAVTTNPPDEIELACHKSRCQRELAAAHIAVPTLLGSVAGYDDLRARMKDARMRRVFVKLEHGASASGVVAYEAGGRGEHAWTTSEIAVRGGKTALYNTRRIARHRDPRVIRALIDELARHGAYAERWFPKASCREHACDVRAVLVAGRVTHVVLRCSKTPFTNLHLGGQRADPSALRERMREDRWDAMLHGVEAVASVFPRSLALGVDVAVGTDLSSHAVLEVNAFGDFLHGVRDSRGRDPYDVQLEAACG
jgi:hypothetical protein